MEHIIFLGDSITDAFHNMDGECLGDGYVRQIVSKLRGGGWRGEVRNAGHDGFTVAKVLKMLAYDCGHFSADMASLLVGCNDVGLWMYTGKSLEEQRFRENYEKLLCKLRREMKIDVVCMGPFVFPSPREYVNWMPAIREVENMERETAEKYGARFLPLQDRLNEEARRRGYAAVTTDGIHLTREGAGLVADEWLREVCKKQ